MKRNKVLFILFTLITLSSGVVWGQETEEERVPFGNRIYFGGDFSLQIGRITFIEVSPIIGYNITPRFAAGLGITYIYYRQRFYNDTIIKAQNYGGRIFSKYLLIDNVSKYIPLQLNAGIIAYGEYEFLNMDGIFSLYDQSNRFWLNNVYVGGGLELPIGRRSKMNFLVLWNLNDTGESPYSNPAVRIGVNF